MKKERLHNVLLLLLGIWPKNNDFKIPLALFWSTLPCLHPPPILQQQRLVSALMYYIMSIEFHIDLEDFPKFRKLNQGE